MEGGGGGREQNNDTAKNCFVQSMGICEMWHLKNGPLNQTEKLSVRRQKKKKNKNYS